jgi:PilZ domain
MVRGTPVEKNRRSLTPPLGVASGGVQGGVHATRRAGARREVSARVALKPLGEPSSSVVLDGWALNVSRGGVRVILEDKVEPGDEFEITLLDTSDRAEGDGGPASARARHGCIVWVQEESDGVIAGIAFKNVSERDAESFRDKPTGD